MPPLVFMAEPDDIHAIVTAPADVLHPGAGAAAIAPLVGESSFMLAEEQQHLTVRKAIMPAFHHRLIVEHEQTITDLTLRALANWPLHTPFALHPHLRSLTLNIILRTLFHHEDPRLPQLHTALLPMLTITSSLALQEPQLRPLPGWRRPWKEFLAHRTTAHTLLDDLIASPTKLCSRDIPSLLLGARQPDNSRLSHEQIRANLMSLILAGHETTASQLAWAVQLLAHSCNARKRLVAAIDRDDDEYLTATIHEVLRHRPVFLFAIPRKVHKPIQVGHWTHDPPAHLLGCIHLMHHDPRIYPSPNAFRPERFLENPPHPQCWLPWGGGRKRCPGSHLATLEMKTILRTILTHRSLMPASHKPEPARWRSVIVTPGNECQIILTARKLP